MATTQYDGDSDTMATATGDSALLGRYEVRCAATTSDSACNNEQSHNDTSTSKGARKRKNKFYWAICLALFRDHLEYGLVFNAVATSGQAIDKRKWMDKIKNCLRNGTMTCNFTAKLGTTGEGIKKEEIWADSKIANIWDKNEASIPWYWDMRDLISERPNLTPVGLVISVIKVGSSDESDGSEEMDKEAEFEEIAKSEEITKQNTLEVVKVKVKAEQVRNKMELAKVKVKVELCKEKASLLKLKMEQEHTFWMATLYLGGLTSNPHVGPSWTVAVAVAGSSHPWYPNPPTNNFTPNNYNFSSTANAAPVDFHAIASTHSHFKSGTLLWHLC
ncbi:hypothetical protein JAAARDRAFT_45212 [Jaapia argillacea MUCL 33604]|uniref:Uncharacterized protein n=1 Tax=Jaapia argillacea MUCL 33604 TaxID=933084 RepID=A0A067QG98_9AGAM|nr:hypothetical protein JAAARDRAFT_45212 [Jaapia argillacea MUCL 33604]